jgi:hypothetical protein
MYITLKYQNIINVYYIKILNFFPSTSSVKGKFFKINKLHGVQFYVDFDFDKCWRGTVYYTVFPVVFRSSYLSKIVC